MRNTRPTWQAQRLTVLICGVLILGMTGSARAQTASCTTLGTQCAPATFGDDGLFTTGFQCYARQVIIHGIMPLCGGDIFCPKDVVTRATGRCWGGCAARRTGQRRR